MVHEPLVLRAALVQVTNAHLGDPAVVTRQIAIHLVDRVGCRGGCISVSGRLVVTLVERDIVGVPPKFVGGSYVARAREGLTVQQSRNGNDCGQEAGTKFYR